MDKGTKFNAYEKHPPHKNHAHRGNPFIATIIRPKWVNCKDKDGLECGLLFDTWNFRGAAK